MTNLISVIVPVFNLEQYIVRCLDSLFAQTHRELEVIAIDDGSTDASPKILDEYAQREPRLKVIHKQNGGVSSARKEGIAAATGDYIGFCDGDDIVEPDMYEHLLANLLKYDADISHCGVCVEGMDGIKRRFYDTGKLCVQSHDEALFELLKGTMIEPSIYIKLFKHSLFKGISIDPAIQYNEDLLLNVLLFRKAEKSVYEDVCLYTYIRRPDSACKGEVADKHVFHPIEVRRRIIDLCAEESLEIQNQAKANFMHAAISAYSLLCSDKAKKYAGYRRRFRRDLKDHKRWLRFLQSSSRAHALIIIYIPILYTTILKIFRFFIKSKTYG